MLMKVQTVRQRPPDTKPGDKPVIRRLRQRAIRLLSRREYSANELRKRLASGSTWARRGAGTVTSAQKIADPARAVYPDHGVGPEPATSHDPATGSKDPQGSKRPRGDRADSHAELAVLQPEAERAPTAEELDQVILQLQVLDLQSDYRFAESLVRRRGARQGVSQLRRLLQSHEIDPDICAELLAPLSQSEFDRAREVWAQRFDRYGSGQQPTDLREKSRQARFLTNRGFSADVVSRVLRSGNGRGAD